MGTEAVVLAKTRAGSVSTGGFAADTATLSDQQRAALIAEIPERLRLLGLGWPISYTG